MPNPPEKQKSAAQKWGEELNGAEAPVDGIDREILRKAMALNPRMKKEEGETAVLVVIPAEQAAAVAAFIAQLNAEAEDHASEPN